MIHPLQAIRDLPTQTQGAMVAGLKLVPVLATLPIMDMVGDDGPGRLALLILGGAMSVRQILASGAGAKPDTALDAPIPDFCTEIVRDRFDLWQMSARLAKKMGITQPVKLYYGETDLAGAFYDKKSGYGIVYNKNVVGLLSADELEFTTAHELGHIRNGDVRPSGDKVLTENIVHAGTILAGVGGLVTGHPAAIVAGIANAELWQVFDRMGQRTRERRNDIEAVAATENPTAAITFFNRLSGIGTALAALEGRPDPAQKAPKYALNKALVAIFSPHPSDQCRADYLKDWRQKQSLEVPKIVPPRP